MKKIYQFLFSMTLGGILLLVLAASMAVATFLENDFGTLAARQLVYDAWWFEALMILLSINMLGAVFVKKLAQRKKYGALLLHISIVIILIGAGITRWIGYEGTMFIREGQTQSLIYSEKPYVQLEIEKDGKTYSFDEQKTFSRFSSQSFDEIFELNDEQIRMELTGFTPNAALSIAEHPEGKPILSLVLVTDGEQQTHFLEHRDSLVFDGYSIGFGTVSSNDMNIVYVNDSLFFSSPFPVATMSMMDRSEDTLAAGKRHVFGQGKLFDLGELNMVVKNFYPKAKIRYISTNNQDGRSQQHALTFSVHYAGKGKEVTALGAEGFIGEPTSFTLKDARFKLTYGPRKIRLPFAIKLIDFQLERYPGSRSPSSYASEVILIDKRKNLEEPYRIFMNNVLNYGGFRFFQSSYDEDEKGTVLSVNHDAAGTLVTYIGYALLAFGMIFSFFNKNSRFRYLIRASSELKRKSKSMAMLIMLALLSTVTGNQMKAQSPGQLPIDENYINKEHAGDFGMLLVQGQDGRIEPLNTLASEIIRKISRKDKIMGMNADQILLGMLAEPARWQSVPMIKIGHKGVREAIGVDGKLAAFIDFFNIQQDGSYKLRAQVEQAYQKKPAERSKFDTELIKTDERLNIAYMVYQGGLLKIFPLPNDEEKRWLNPTDAARLIKDSTAALFVKNILPMYYDSVKTAILTGNWNKPAKTLSYIKAYQEKYGKDLFPSDAKLSMEITYNRIDIFKRLYQVYGLLGFVMLIFLFINIFNPKRKFKIPLNILISLLIVGFIMHTLGLAMRWYISGHAPWSNGYESMIYIAWATMLAGLLFMNKSRIALATTAILSSLILMIAHLSWMDPQITNLVPVLKSYWLVIHVAVITASYSFLGLGALMGFFNLILMILKNKKNREKLNLNIQELTYIAEMTLTIGLVMLTIGTFLGGIWANESWGRYWGWDPKETWALITILIYGFVLHMRLIPGLRGAYVFNLAALISYGSVIMTYFGVNYYLSGLHSYAAGDPVPVPTFVYYVVAIIGITGLWAYLKHQAVEKTE
ncbi:MAG: c-type cytochrome biogenesis protein CcsB [Bacteroidales bacterium]|nr:c-type cytochrome biogenesis protein CcsB [Bacteroidales bacterium]